MFFFSRSIALTLAATSAFAQAESTAEVQLLAPPAVVAGSVVEVALELTPAESLHVYYINPGEMGQPVQLTWSELPEGITAGDLRFPIPHRVKTGELATNGYEETTHFFNSLTIAPSVEPGTYQLKAKASWLACNDTQCLMGKEDLKLNLEVLAKSKIAAEKSEASPKGLDLIPVNADASWKSKVQKDGKNWLLELAAPADWEAPANKLDAFSETSDFFKPGALPTITQTEQGLQISVAASEYSDDLSAATIVIAGVTPPLRIPVQLIQRK